MQHDVLEIDAEFQAAPFYQKDTKKFHCKVSRFLDATYIIGTV